MEGDPSMDKEKEVLYLIDVMDKIEMQESVERRQTLRERAWLYVNRYPRGTPKALRRAAKRVVRRDVSYASTVFRDVLVDLKKICQDIATTPKVLLQDDYVLYRAKVEQCLELIDVMSAAERVWSKGLVAQSFVYVPEKALPAACSAIKSCRAIVETYINQRLFWVNEVPGVAVIGPLESRVPLYQQGYQFVPVPDLRGQDAFSQDFSHSHSHSHAQPQSSQGFLQDEPLRRMEEETCPCAPNYELQQEQERLVSYRDALSTALFGNVLQQTAQTHESLLELPEPTQELQLVQHVGALEAHEAGLVLDTVLFCVDAETRMILEGQPARKTFLVDEDRREMNRILYSVPDSADAKREPSPKRRRRRVCSKNADGRILSGKGLKHTMLEQTFE